MHSENGRQYWLHFSVVFVVLQLLDGIFTCVGVFRYGMFLEENPVSTHLFAKWGIIESTVLLKLFSIAIFFGLLWYCRTISWSLMDVLGLLWGRTPKRDKAYAMKNFYLAAAVMTLAGLYVSGGWIYVFYLMKNAL